VSPPRLKSVEVVDHICEKVNEAVLTLQGLLNCSHVRFAKSMSFLLILRCTLGKLGRLPHSHGSKGCCACRIRKQSDIYSVSLYYLTCFRIDNRLDLLRGVDVELSRLPKSVTVTYINENFVVIRQCRLSKSPAN